MIKMFCLELLNNLQHPPRDNPWPWPLSPIVLNASNCIEGLEVKPISWVDKIMMELG
jgi:hypothetical protein